MLVKVRNVEADDRSVNARHVVERTEPGREPARAASGRPGRWDYRAIPWRAIPRPKTSKSVSVVVSPRNTENPRVFAWERRQT